MAWLENRHAGNPHVCMEATGAYWEALALYLHGLEYRVSVINPARIKAFGQIELLRTKTDEVDAALIARFCKSQNPEPWIPPPPEIRILQALMRHYEHLKTTRVQQSLYEQSSDAAVVKASIREVIATLDAQIAQGICRLVATTTTFRYVDSRTSAPLQNRQLEASQSALYAGDRRASV